MADSERTSDMDRITKLMQLGFVMDEFGALVAKGCMVTLYREADSTWAFDISLPSGSAIGCEVALDDIEVNDDQTSRFW